MHRLFKADKKSSEKASRGDAQSKRKDDSKSDRPSKESGRSKSNKPSKEGSNRNDCPDKPDVFTECTARCLWVKPTPNPNNPASYRDVLPLPKPTKPLRSRDESEEQYEESLLEWENSWDYWSKITCPCKRGYFCTAHMQWVSGDDVRRGKAPSKGKQSPTTCHSQRTNFEDAAPLTRPSTNANNDYDDDAEDYSEEEEQGYPVVIPGTKQRSQSYSSEYRTRPQSAALSGLSYPNTQSNMSPIPRPTISLQSEGASRLGYPSAQGYISPLSRPTQAPSTMIQRPYPLSYSAAPQLQLNQQSGRVPAMSERQRLTDTAQGNQSSYPGLPQRIADQTYSTQPSNPQLQASPPRYPTAGTNYRMPIRSYSQSSGYPSTQPVSRGYPSQMQLFTGQSTQRVDDRDDDVLENRNYERREPSSQGLGSFSGSMTVQPRAYPSSFGQTQRRNYEYEPDDDDEEQDDGNEEEEEEEEGVDDEYDEQEENNTQQYVETPAPRQQVDRHRHPHRHRERDHNRKPSRK